MRRRASVKKSIRNITLARNNPLMLVYALIGVDIYFIDVED